jgi:ABC-type amino acid transport substrate-binding protein
VPRLLGVAFAALLASAAGGAAAQQEGIEGVRQRGYLKVCADPDNPPYSSKDPAAPGFEVELARLVALELGVEARFVWHLTHVRPLKPLRAGSCELFMGLPADARFRDGNPWIRVTQPYYVMGHALVSRAGRPATLEALAGQRVAVELASVAELYIGYRDVVRGLYRSQEMAFQAAINGEAAAALLWHPVAAWLARGRSELKVTPVAARELEFPIGAGVRKREPGLGDAVDAAVGRLVAGGRAAEVFGRYGMRSEPRSERPGSFVLAQANDPIDRGRSLYSTVCSRCHGADGAGGGPGGSVPTLRNYDGGWEKFSRLVLQGRKNTAMAGFKGILTDDEVSAIYRYLTSLPRT